MACGRGLGDGPLGQRGSDVAHLIPQQHFVDSGLCSTANCQRTVSGIEGNRHISEQIEGALVICCSSIDFSVLRVHHLTAEGEEYPLIARQHGCRGQHYRITEKRYHQVPRFVRTDFHCLFAVAVSEQGARTVDVEPSFKTEVFVAEVDVRFSNSGSLSSVIVCAQCSLVLYRCTVKHAGHKEVVFRQFAAQEGLVEGDAQFVSYVQDSV